jgi:hypothetical protein
MIALTATVLGALDVPQQGVHFQQVERPDERARPRGRPDWPAIPKWPFRNGPSYRALAKSASMSRTRPAISAPGQQRWDLPHHQRLWPQRLNQQARLRK